MIPEESESETVRESRCIPGNDPTDVNRGEDFVFLDQEANERMRRNKRKVRYVFEEEEKKRNSPALLLSQITPSQQQPQMDNTHHLNNQNLMQ